MVGNLLKHIGQAGLRRKNPGTGGIFDAACGERTLGDFHLEIGEAIASGKETFLAGIFKQKCGACTRDFAAGLRRFGKKCE